MASRFAFLKEIPERDSGTLSNDDFILLGSKDKDDLEIFAKTRVGEFHDYLRNKQLAKLNIRSTYYPYLYEIDCNDYNYDDGIKAFNYYRVPEASLDELPIQISSAYPGGCVSVHKNGLVGHNVDRRFDENASFVVHTSPKYEAEDGVFTISRYATLGMSTGFNKLTKSFVDSRNYSDIYKLVPLYITDGINDQGLAVTMDALPAYDNPNLGATEQYSTSGTHPELEYDLCALMVTRVILDNCKNINEVLPVLGGWNIWCPCIPHFDYEYAWTITDSTGKVIRLELIDNSLKVIETTRKLSKPNVSSNFYLWKYDGNMNNILIQDAHSTPINKTLTRHSRGLERYYVVRKWIEKCGDNLEGIDIFNAFDESYFSMAYLKDTDPSRYSDFNYNWGDPYGDLQVNSMPEDYEGILNKFKENFENQLIIKSLRCGTTMFTCYSTVYDLSTLSMKIKCDELYSTGLVLDFKLAAVTHRDK